MIQKILIKYLLIFASLFLPGVCFAQVRGDHSLDTFINKDLGYYPNNRSDIDYCMNKHNQYGVIPGVTWGSSPMGYYGSNGFDNKLPSYYLGYSINNCDLIIAFNIDSISVVSQNVLSTPSSTNSPMCIALSEKHGIRPYITWGTASEGFARTFYDYRGCNPIVTKSIETKCKEEGTIYGLMPFISWGSLPSNLISYHDTFACNDILLADVPVMCKNLGKTYNLIPGFTWGSTPVGFAREYYNKNVNACDSAITNYRNTACPIYDTDACGRVTHTLPNTNIVQFVFNSPVKKNYPYENYTPYFLNYYKVTGVKDGVTNTLPSSVFVGADIGVYKIKYQMYKGDISSSQTFHVYDKSNNSLACAVSLNKKPDGNTSFSFFTQNVLKNQWSYYDMPVNSMDNNANYDVNRCCISNISTVVNTGASVVNIYIDRPFGADGIHCQDTNL